MGFNLFKKLKRGAGLFRAGIHGISTGFNTAWRVARAISRVPVIGGIVKPVIQKAGNLPVIGGVSASDVKTAFNTIDQRLNI
jgi:hypothetical protein